MFYLTSSQPVWQDGSIILKYLATNKKYIHGTQQSQERSANPQIRKRHSWVRAHYENSWCQEESFQLVGSYWGRDEETFQFPKGLKQQNPTANHSIEGLKNSSSTTVVGSSKKNHRTVDASRKRRTMIKMKVIKENDPIYLFFKFMINEQ